MQAWLQPMQARMSSSRPCAVLAGSSGSQMSARVMTHRSACAGGEDRLGLLGLADAPGDHHRDPDDAPSSGRRAAPCSRSAMGDGGTMWSEPASVADVPGDHAHVVHRPVGVERRERRERLVLGQARRASPRRSRSAGPPRTRAAVAARHAASASRRNRSRPVASPPHASVAQVRARVEELRRQVPVRGDDLARRPGPRAPAAPRPPRSPSTISRDQRAAASPAA